MEDKAKYRPNPKLKLLDQVREVLRYYHYAYRTEQTYCDWIKRYLRYYSYSKHPREMGPAEIERFLSHLAVEGKVAASTQRQALNAIVFLYRDVLDIELGDIAHIRSKKQRHPPTVLTQKEVVGPDTLIESPARILHCWYNEGTEVVTARNVSKAFGNRLLFDNVNFDLPPGGIVGIIGGNGAGKTTLFKMITDQETPTEGTLELGDSVDISYVGQLRDDLDPNKTTWEEISGGEETIEVGGRTMNSRAYCARFNFKGAEQQKKVGVLSGGERNRVHLAKLLRRGGNLLLLDEPTNDLDVATLRSLEEGLINFGGCAVVISHDRWFLDRVATHILAFEGDEVLWHEGNYESFKEFMRQRKGDNWQPHRVHYRPLKNG